MPSVALSSPDITINKDVLPEPDGPTIPTISPVLIERSIFLSTLTGPAALVKVRHKFVISIMMIVYRLAIVMLNVIGGVMMIMQTVQNMAMMIVICIHIVIGI